MHTIRIRTSRGLGGATITSSITSLSPAFLETAAAYSFKKTNKDPSVLEINRKLSSKAVIDGPLHRMGFPAVLTESFSSMVSKTNRVCDSVKVSLQWLMQLDSYINNAENDSRATTYQPTKHLGNISLTSFLLTKHRKHLNYKWFYGLTYYRKNPNKKCAVVAKFRFPS